MSRGCKSHPNKQQRVAVPSIMLLLAGGLVPNMAQPLFPSTIGTQSHSAKFLTITTVVRKTTVRSGQTGSRCLDEAVLPQRGGGVRDQHLPVL